MAIAVDTTGNGKQAAGNTLTFSYTTTGSNIALMVGFFSATSDQAGTMAFGTTNIPQLGAVAQGGIGRFCYLYGGIVPAQTANIVINGNTSSDVIAADCASYTGVSGVVLGQTKQTAASTTYAITDTTTNDNSWDVMFARCGNTLSAGSGTFLRSTTAADVDTALFDSNQAITPAGSYTLNASESGAGVIWGGVSGILSPAVAVAAVAPRRRSLIGVGS